MKSLYDPSRLLYRCSSAAERLKRRLLPFLLLP